MNKLRIKITYLLNMLFLCIILPTSTYAASNTDSIGELITTDGKKFEISQFGSKETQKNYFLKTNSRFIPIKEVRHITRIDTQAGRFAYLIVLFDGGYETGRQGLLFYEHVTFTDPSNGKIKTAYTPVIKDRGQSGLIFTALISNKTEKVIEISYPNNIDRISLNYESQPAMQAKQKSVQLSKK